MLYPELKLKLVSLNRLLHQVQVQITTEQFASAIIDLNQSKERIVEFCMLTANTHFENLFHELDILSHLDSTIIALNTATIYIDLFNSKLSYSML